MTIIAVGKLGNTGYVNADGTVSCMVFTPGIGFEIKLSAELARELGAGLTRGAKRAADGERDEK